VAERVLTVRELNRATLARQLLLQRKRLRPVAVVERLVGMQAQWPPAPYVGIWTRTTSFRRAALERELARGTVVKALCHVRHAARSRTRPSASKPSSPTER
jgi:hypothetical protein